MFSRRVIGCQGKKPFNNGIRYLDIWGYLGTAPIFTFLKKKDLSTTENRQCSPTRIDCRRGLIYIPFPGLKVSLISQLQISLRLLLNLLG